MNDVARPDLAFQAQYWAGQLRENGYVIIPDVIDTDIVDALQNDLIERFDKTPFCDGLFYGANTKRFGRLLALSRHSQAFIRHDLILAIVNQILRPYCSTIQLNLTQALEVHPGSRAQVPHRDQDMWAGPKGEVEYLVNVMWPFTPYTRENGATMLWPDSHRQQDQMLLDPENRLDAEMEPGSVLLFLGSTLHNAGENSSDMIRRGMIVSYCLGWLKPYENQWLAYPPEVARTFDPELAALVGYCQHQPNLGNYEGQCPSVLLKNDVPEFLHAIDDLRPDQVQMVEDFYAGRLQAAA
ncbi:phytanoyl-CoA dioxygenase family protein [Sphingobium sp. DEHP117]|nr:phytanoyl-CoA dioxygenase family protein [Sphingobium sp. DEHP117]MDQ4420967.1 phytanoyl-CoA dioxygenase family protein [Sphingobium sp. DEHP117]